MYKPPFTITNEMINRIASISEKIGKASSYESLDKKPILRRNNRIKSIHSSLAIEANSLSLNNVRELINGKVVLGPKREIQEVKNAYKAYDMFEEFNPFDQKDLLKAHSILTYLIDDENGKYRRHGEGVYNGDKVIFVAPPADIVPKLMDDLFDWLGKDKETHISIKSCVFHYEFLFIHPFSDGNGRTARLWQNLLLSKWNKIFEFVPIESKIKEYQEEYYSSIAACHSNGNSNVFIEFVLKMIDETLTEVLITDELECRNISAKVNSLLDILEYDIPLSANEIMKKLGIKSKETLRNSYLNPAIRNGLVKMSIPTKPNSKNQKYYK